jgi:hypothetical protein
MDKAYFKVEDNLSLHEHNVEILRSHQYTVLEVGNKELKHFFKTIDTGVHLHKSKVCVLT